MQSDYERIRFWLLCHMPDINDMKRVGESPYPFDTNEVMALSKGEFTLLKLRCCAALGIIEFNETQKRFKIND